MAKDYLRIKKIPGVDRILSLLQSNVDDLVTQVQAFPPIRGVLLVDEELPLTGTDYVIVHGLGRPYQGYIVASRAIAGHIFTSSTANNSPETQIILRTSAAGQTVNLWVF
jgi:hypothetical protein